MRKFLINDNELKLMNVECHFEMAKDHTTTKGGGWWFLDDINNIVYLYSTSIDFGCANREDLQILIKNEQYPLSFEGCKFIHSYSSCLEDAIEDGVALN